MRASARILAVAAIVVVCGLGGAPWAQEGAEPPREEALQDKMCDTPENVTGLLLLDSFGLAKFSVAWDGEAYGIVYAREYPTPSAEDIYFARIAADGTVLSGPSLISPGLGSFSTASVTMAWTGSEYGVAWAEQNAWTKVIRFRRVARDGQALDSIQILAYPSSGTNVPRIVWNGGGYGLFYKDPEIYFLGLDTAGSVLSGPLQLTLYSPGYFDAEWGAGKYCVASTEASMPSTYIRRQLLDSTGTVLVDANYTPWGRTVDSLRLAWTGTSFSALWSSNQDFGDRVLRITDFYPSGDFVEHNTNACHDVDREKSGLALVWTGAEFGVFYCEPSNLVTPVVLYSRVTHGGTLLMDSDIVASSGYRNYLPGWRAVAFGKLGFGIFSFDFDSGGVRFTGLGCHGDTTPPPCPSNLQSTGQTESTVGLAWAASYDTQSEIAYYSIYRNGAFLARTTDRTYMDTGLSAGTTYDYYVTATNAPQWESSGCASLSVATASPVPCDTAPFGPSTLLQQPGSIEGGASVWDGSAFGIVWADAGSELQFARVAADGTMLSGPTQLTAYGANCTRPSLAWTGSEYGIAYHTDRTGSSEIAFLRVSASGTLVAGSDLLITAAADTQLYPSLVWTGTEYGLAWADRRNGTGADLAFARIDAAGAEVPGSEAVVYNAPTDISDVVLAWNGSAYGTAYSRGAQVYFTRLNATGGFVSEVQVSSASVGNNLAPSLVWTGTEYGLAWRGFTADVDIYFARLSATGVLQGSVRTLTAPGSSQDAPSLAWEGAGYGLGYIDNRSGSYELYFTRLDALGNRVDCDRALTGSAQVNHVYARSLAWSGKGFGLAFKNQTPGQMRFVGLGDADDTTPPSCPQAPHEVSRELMPPAVTLGWGASSDTGSGLSHYEVYRDWALLGRTTSTTYRDDTFDPAAGYVYDIVAVDAVGLSSVGCASVDTADPTPPACPSGLTSPSQGYNSIALSWVAAVDPESGIATYKVYRDGAFLADTAMTTYADTGLQPGTSYAYAVLAVNGAGLSSAGCPASAFSTLSSDQCLWASLSGVKGVRTSTQTQGTSAVWNGADYGVAWIDDSSGNLELYFARYAAGGALLAGPTQLTSDANYKVAPSLVWNGAGYAVAWEDWRNGHGDVYAMTVGADGTPGTVVRVTTDANYQGTPSLVWNGTGYGVAWADGRNPGTDYDIYFVRLDASCNPTGGEKVVANPMGYQQLPSLAWNGTGYGVAYRSDFTGQQINFRGLDASGNPATGEVYITAGPANHGAPSLLWNGTNYALAWHGDSGGSLDIYFAKLATNGSKIGSDSRVTTDPSMQMNPSLALAGAEYGVAWQDMRGGGTDIYFAPLNESGVKTQAEIQLSVRINSNNISPRTLAAGADGFCAVWANWEAVSPDATQLATLGCSGDTTPPSCPGTPRETDRDWFPPADAVTLSWGASSDLETGISHYEVYRDWVLLARTTATSYRDATFNHAAGYVYDIVAVNAAGLPSVGCPSVDTTDSVPPTCPGNLMAVGVAETQVDLSWLPSTDALSGFSLYLVYRDNQWLDYAFGTTYSDLTVSGGTTYNYAIVPNDYAGNQRFDCQTLWVSTSPILLKMTKNTDGLNADLDWNDVGLNQYIVYRSTSPQVGQEHQRVPLSETQDTVLKDGIQLWFYYIQQRE